MNLNNPKTRTCQEYLFKSNFWNTLFGTELTANTNTTNKNIINITNQNKLYYTVHIGHKHAFPNLFMDRSYSLSPPGAPKNSIIHYEEGERQTQKLVRWYLIPSQPKKGHAMTKYISSN